jgi:hypothetical protein
MVGGEAMSDTLLDKVREATTENGMTVYVLTREELDTLRSRMEQLRHRLVLTEAELAKMREVVAAAQAWREQTEAEDNPFALLAALDALAALNQQTQGDTDHE